VQLVAPGSGRTGGGHLQTDPNEEPRMEKTDTLEEKQHKEIVAALYKIASEIIGLKSELTTVRHVLSEIGKKVGN
jgi:hypothetical protein